MKFTLWLHTAKVRRLFILLFVLIQVVEKRIGGAEGQGTVYTMPTTQFNPSSSVPNQMSSTQYQTTAPTTQPTQTQTVPVMQEGSH